MVVASKHGVVTFDQAEELLEEAFHIDWAEPDKDAGFQRAGSRSCWPAIVRDVITDYADTDAVPRRQNSRKDLALRKLMFGPEGRPLFLSLEPVPVPGKEDDVGRAVKLVKKVVLLRLSQGSAGFSWSEVWEWDCRVAG